MFDSRSKSSGRKIFGKIGKMLWNDRSARTRIASKNLQLLRLAKWDVRLKVHRNMNQIVSKQGHPPTKLEIHERTARSTKPRKRKEIDNQTSFISTGSWLYPDVFRLLKTSLKLAHCSPSIDLPESNNDALCTVSPGMTLLAGRVHHRSSSELVTTLTEENAIAAPAIMGCR